MKLTTFLATFTCLGFTAASPVSPRGDAASPEQERPNPRAHLVWDPPNAYKNHKKRKFFWEKKCDEALPKEGCGYGTIHQGQGKMTRSDGKEALYIHVEGAPSKDMMDNAKKMRVFQDGSSEVLDDWSDEARKSISEGKRNRDRKTKTVLVWDPPNAYSNYRKRKAMWQQKCGEALTSHGCGYGIVHQGQGKMIRSGGKKAYYIHVEGAPSKDDMMKKMKKMRVFDDGSSEVLDEWSLDARKLMLDAKRLQKKVQPLKDRKTVLVWQPPSAYERHKVRKSFWEEKCDEALIGKGCSKGVIHQGEGRITHPNGRTIAYINVEGQGASAGKKWRVHDDASTEDFTEHGWPEADLIMMKRAKEGTQRRIYRDAPIEGGLKHSITWDSPRTYQQSPRMRHAYQESCERALENEGCDFAILKGRHRQKNPDGTFSPYITVAAGKKNDPDNKRFMRLFENGSYKWYSVNEVPKKELENWTGSLKNTGAYRRPSGRPGAPALHKRPRGRPRKEANTAAVADPQVPTKAPPPPVDPGRNETPNGGEFQNLPTQAKTWAPVQPVDLGQVHAPGDEYHYYSPIQPPTPHTWEPTWEHTWDNPKRRRVGGYDDELANIGSINDTHWTELLDGPVTVHNS